MNNTITKKDIIFASYPKSGKTWVRFFIGSYINNLYNLGADINWDNFIKFAPGYQEVNLFNFDCDKFVFSHHKVISKYFEGRDCIYLTRDFCDILVSMYFFCRNRKGTLSIKEGINSFVRNYDFKKAANILNMHFKELRLSKKFTIIRYEDLILKPDISFKEIIMFSRYPFDKESFDKAMKFSSFTSMREMEEKDKKFKSEDDYHTRKAQIGNYKNYLNKKSVKIIKDSMNLYFDKEVLKYYE